MTASTVTPTPLKTILTPTRYPFAVAKVAGGKIVCTIAYARNLEDCYNQVQGWRASDASYNFKHEYVAAEMVEIGDRTPNSVNTYWVAV